MLWNGFFSITSRGPGDTENRLSQPNSIYNQHTYREQKVMETNPQSKFYYRKLASKDIIITKKLLAIASDYLIITKQYLGWTSEVHLFFGLL